MHNENSRASEAREAVAVYRKSIGVPDSREPCDIPNICQQTVRGATYVYETPGVTWDSIKKRNNIPREYIGKLDANGLFIPNKHFLQRIKDEQEKKLSLANKQHTFQAGTTENQLVYLYPIVLGYGGSYLLEEIAKRMNVIEDLQICFEDDWQLILSVAFYLITYPKPAMTHIKYFSNHLYLPSGMDLCDRRISELLKRIEYGHTFRFSELRQARHKAMDVYFCDGTSVCSYSEQMKNVKFGASKDNPKLKQVCVSVVFSRETNEPVSFRTLPGNIPDVSTVRKLILDMKFVTKGIKHILAIMDRGFYSKKNVEDFIKEKIDFIMGGKKEEVVYMRVFIKDALETLKQNKYYDNQLRVYAKTYKYKWQYLVKGKVLHKTIYIHIYISKDRETLNFFTFQDKLSTVVNKLLSKKKLKLDEELIYLKYLKVTGGKNNRILKVALKHTEIEKKLDSLGLFVLLSNCESDASKALSFYRERDIVEKSINTFKRKLGNATTTVFSEEAFEGKLFIEFVAEILTSRIHFDLNRSKELKHLSVQELINDLNLIKRFDHADVPFHYNEITKLQDTIFTHFGIPAPKNIV
jgi:transposase